MLLGLGGGRWGDVMLVLSKEGAVCVAFIELEEYDSYIGFIL